MIKGEYVLGSTFLSSGDLETLIAKISIILDYDSEYNLDTINITHDDEKALEHLVQLDEQREKIIFALRKQVLD